MNNEFKKIKTNTETRYILEDGATVTTGAVATAPSTLGTTQKRNNNILTQETDKKKQTTTPPRNFVAKNAKMGGAGAHKDRKKEIPRKAKHKKPAFEDHEISMASSELQNTAKEAVQILKMIQQYSEEQGLEAWQQSKITKAADYLHSVLQSISGKQGLPESIETPADLARQMRSLQTQQINSKRDANFLLIKNNLLDRAREKGIDTSRYEVSVNPMSNQSRAVDVRGRTQTEWMDLVKKKFPTASIKQSKMIDGPCFAILPDGSRLEWKKVEQDPLAEFLDTQATAQDPGLEKEKDVDIIFYGRMPQDFEAATVWEALEEVLPGEYPPGNNKIGQPNSNAENVTIRIKKDGGAVVTNKPLSVAKKLVTTFQTYGIKCKINNTNEGLAEEAKSEILFYAKLDNGHRVYARVKDEEHLADLRQEYNNAEEVKTLDFTRPDVQDWLKKRGVEMRTFVPGTVTTIGDMKEQNVSDNIELGDNSVGEPAWYIVGRDGSIASIPYDSLSAAQNAAKSRKWYNSSNYDIAYGSEDDNNMFVSAETGQDLAESDMYIQSLTAKLNKKLISK